MGFRTIYATSMDIWSRYILFSCLRKILLIDDLQLAPAKVSLREHEHILTLTTTCH
jgi:hypothetical protein